MTKKTKKRLIYALISLVIFITEVLIALYVDDNFIRPFGGDILVVILIACIVRIISPDKIRLLALWVFIFSVAVETAQYFDIVNLLGLGDITFFAVLIGTSFSFIDIICYAAGCLIFFAAEALLNRKDDINA
ncbi:MAG: DUF2809 domain-containing protein [Clostridia bacterium]|nr:DUF2809 domain-containing protein [Clostridia bacterium]